MPQAGMLKRWRFNKAGPATSPSSSLQTDGSEDDWRPLAQACGLSETAAKLLFSRGVTDPDSARKFLEPRLTDLHDPLLLPGVDRAARRLLQARAAKQPIVIYGDYDVDGVTASAILWHMLTLMGAAVTTYIPHRIEEGYGLNSDAIRTLAVISPDPQIARSPDHSQTNAVTPPLGHSATRPLLISVDCGITAIEPAKVARELGIDLIITDHHEFDPANLPDAYALVHPRLVCSTSTLPLPSEGEGRPALSEVEGGGEGLSSPPPYPFPDLCGAGVAFKLAWHIARLHCDSEKLPDEFKKLLLDLLSLAALGTVADVSPLVGENRVIAVHGLGQIKRTRFAGLNALIDATDLRDREKEIDSFHVGFVLGPRLNACGRMGHARQAVELLTTADAPRAAEIARFLSSENERRRRTEREIFLQAKEMTIAAGYDKDDCRAIVLGSEGWHPGVVGVVCSRLVEAFSRPTILLCFDNGQAQGSARSVEGLSICDAISHGSKLLTSFGGHAMAAGLKMPTANLDAFRAAVLEYVHARLQPSDLTSLLDIEALCRLEDLTLDMVAQIQRPRPFGRGNPAPILLVRDVTLDKPAERIGAQGRHLRLMLRQGRRVMQAVWFGAGDFVTQLPGGTHLDVAFEPHLSTWNGSRRAEVHVKDLRLLR